MSKEEYYGFMGKVLNINLTDQTIKEETINRTHARNFFGGAGYACRYLIDKIEKTTDPLSDTNIFMVMNGPFSLTRAPSFGRFTICAKSPYTDFWGEANAGGSFGPELKKAGYDGIIIEGKSEKPVYIKIIDGNTEILDASKYWGCGIKKTQNRLKHHLGDFKSKLMCIGQGGENLVKYANVNSEGRSAGRTGLGAVMGSKNLKAIQVKGNNLKPKIAEPEKFKDFVKKALKDILDSMITKTLREYGTSAGVMGAHSVGDLPIKYWTQGEWDKVFNISGEELKENFLIKNKSCYGCAIGCGRIIKLNGEKAKVGDYEGPEYETIAGFGSMILNDDLESIGMANNLCNDYGIDTISTSSTIAFLFYLYNQGVISKEDVDGLELNWGNSKAMLELVKKIAFREGIGNLAAKGSNALGKYFNVSREQIAAVKNLEVPYHDIRSCYGLALTYAFAPRGACHTSGDVFKTARKGTSIDYSSLGINKIDMHSNSKEMAKISALNHDYRALYSSLISCFFSNPNPEYMAGMIEGLFGYEFSVEDLKIAGERIFTLKRLFNLKMGLTPKDEDLPEILLTPTQEGAAKGRVPDFKQLKRYYYDLRDWDPNTGIPSSNKLKKLGLNDISF